MLGRFLRDVIKLNQRPRTFRLFGPDETNSNRLSEVYEASAKQWGCYEAFIHIVDSMFNQHAKWLKVTP